MLVLHKKIASAADSRVIRYVKTAACDWLSEVPHGIVRNDLRNPPKGLLHTRMRSHTPLIPERREKCEYRNSREGHKPRSVHQYDDPEGSALKAREEQDQDGGKDDSALFSHAIKIGLQPCDRYRAGIKGPVRGTSVRAARVHVRGRPAPMQRGDRRGVYVVAGECATSVPIARSCTNGRIPRSRELKASDASRL